jgi:hypothetical protein
LGRLHVPAFSQPNVLNGLHILEAKSVFGN